MAKKDRVGEKFVSNEGYEVVIVEYNSYSDVVVEIQDEYKTRIHTKYYNCQRRQVKNPYHPSVHGHGYLGLMSDGTRPRTIDENGRHTREYIVWSSMIQRVYSEKLHETRPSYKGTILEDCLHCFAYFLEFVIKDIPNYEYWLEHPNERISLDKDIRGNGAKVYSRDTIMFVSVEENNKERNERCGNTRQPTKVYGVNVKTGEKTKVFNSISEAGHEIGVSKSCIGESLRPNGRQKSAGGYKWFKVEE